MERVITVITDERKRNSDERRRRKWKRTWLGEGLIEGVEGEMKGQDN